jgi:plastocyanin
MMVRRLVIALAAVLVLAGCSTGASGATATSGGPPCVPHGTVLHVIAQNIAFNVTCLAAPAGKPFEIVFDNRDRGIPHNVAIYTTGVNRKVLFRGKVFDGPAIVTYHVPALPAGTYLFQCDVHFDVMRGTFVVR